MGKLNAAIVCDFETGGLDPSKNPALSIAYQAFELDTYKPILEFESFIQPYDSLVIEDSALKVNGITYAQMSEGLETKQIVERLTDDFSRANISGFRAKPILIGHNFGFDIGFLCYIFNKHKKDLGKLLDTNKNHLGQEIPKYVDTQILAKQKWGTMTHYNLTACCNKAGIEIFDAHSVMNDVKATKELFLYLTNHLRTGEAVSVESQEQRPRNHFKF